MEDRLAVISCIISNPESVAMVNEKLHLQSSMIIARLGVPCREYGVSVISIVMHGTQNQISSFAGDRGKGKIHPGTGGRPPAPDRPIERQNNGAYGSAAVPDSKHSNPHI